MWWPRAPVSHHIADVVVPESGRRGQRAGHDAAGRQATADEAHRADPGAGTDPLPARALFGRGVVHVLLLSPTAPGEPLAIDGDRARCGGADGNPARSCENCLRVPVASLTCSKAGATGSR